MTTDQILVEMFRVERIEPGDGLLHVQCVRVGREDADALVGALNADPDDNCRYTKTRIDAWEIHDLINGLLQDAERRKATLVYAEKFLAEFEHLRCIDDCEGFRDPCRACIIHEALRRLRGQCSIARSFDPLRRHEMETKHPPLLGLGAVLVPENQELATRQRDAFNHAALAYARVAGSCVPEGMRQAIDTYLRVMREGVHNDEEPVSTITITLNADAALAMQAALNRTLAKLDTTRDDADIRCLQPLVLQLGQRSIITET